LTDWSIVNKVIAGDPHVKLPLVSVIIAVKNGEKYLQAAIESVRRNDYQAREIIVVDGGSKDDSRLIAKSFDEITLIDQEGNGLCDAWNVGVRAANGSLVAFLDSDDLWSSNKLRLQVRYMQEHPEIQYCVGRVKFFLELGCAIPPGFRSKLLEGDHVGRIPGTLLARRSLFDSIGTFDTSFIIAGDVDWFARAKDHQIPMAILDEVLLYKRVHTRNLSSNARLNSEELLGVFRISVDRQRRKTETT
jgi:glycosyltransferase involved in cell wall biosynthesis